MTVHRSTTVALVLILAAGACGEDTDQTGGNGSRAGRVSVAITSPEPGKTIGGNVVTLDLETTGITIAPADGDSSGKTGHFHVFIDRPVPTSGTIPAEEGIVHSATEPIEVGGLSPGEHRFVVVLGDGTHTRLGGAQAETRVTTEGPNVDASAPATAEAGQPVTVQVEVEGVQIVKADGKASKDTGHLHVLVDKQLPAAGQPIPTDTPGIIHTTETSISVPDLAAGDHTLLVVLADGRHVPFDPPVRDTLKVRVQ